jgi:hypothetical protein
MAMRRQEGEGFNWHFAICWGVIIPFYFWFVFEFVKMAWKWFVS